MEPPKDPEWIKAIRAGRPIKEIAAALYAQRLREWKFLCSHCGHEARSRALKYDMPQLCLRATCHLCGKETELPFRDFKAREI